MRTTGFQKIPEDANFKYKVNFSKKELVAKSFGRNEAFNASYLTVSNEDTQTTGDTHYIWSTGDTHLTLGVK